MAASPLRILHAIHDFLPQVQAGSEIYAFNLCRELLTRGHHVTVLCATFDPARPHGHVTWRVVGGLPVVEITNNWTSSSFDDTYRDPIITSRVDSVLEAVQPDVVHVHNLLNLSFELPRLARERGARSVATLHDYTLVCPSGGQRIHKADRHVCRQIDPVRCARCFGESAFGSRAAWGRLTSGSPLAGTLMLAARVARSVAPRLAANAAASLPTVALTSRDVEDRLAHARRVFDDIELFVAPSASMRSEFVALGISPDRVRVSDYGFPPFDSTSQVRGFDRDAPLRVGFVGTPVWHKGVHVLIEAARMLPAASFALEIFGDTTIFPDYCADLEARAGDLPVRFAGAFSRAQLADIYRRFDVLAVPSLWLENSPLVIHEAFMAGVPVVASDIGGIPDLVRHGENGLLFETNSAPALADALRRLIGDRDLVARLASSRTPVKTIEVDATEWEAVYEAVAVGSVAPVPS